MEPIKGTVESLLETLKSRVVRGGGIEETILGAFSPKEQEHIRVCPAQRGLVRIAVDSSTWLYYFTLRKKKLIEKIAAGLPEIKDIVFVIGEVGSKVKKG